MTQTTNFAFLRPSFPQLHEHAAQAECLIFAAPRASCFYARFALEQAVLWLYENDPNLRLPYEHSLGALIHEPTFQRRLKPGLFPKIRLIQKMGNKAVHQSRDVPEDDALRLVQELFHILYWLARSYSRQGRELPNLVFDREKIPRPTAPEEQALTKQQLEELEEQLSKSDELRRIEAERRQKSEAELEAIRAEIDAIRQQAGVFAGGDAVHGASSIVQAIADARRACRTICAREGLSPVDELPHEQIEATPAADALAKRAHRLWRAHRLDRPADRRRDFAPVSRVMSPDEARREAARCLACDRFCGLCVTVCPNRALQLYESPLVQTRLPAWRVEAGAPPSRRIRSPSPCSKPSRSCTWPIGATPVATAPPFVPPAGLPSRTSHTCV
jgi:ferredoxin